MGRSLSVARLQATTEGKPQDYIRATFVSRMRCTSWHWGYANFKKTFEILNNFTHCRSIKLIILNTPACNPESSFYLLQINIAIQLLFLGIFAIKKSAKAKEATLAVTATPMNIDRPLLFILCTSLAARRRSWVYRVFPGNKTAV
uniref:Uncharacterized protein n=1 Tax=Oryza nivara TaxID=4536 RepID=A0A0E0H0P2_ORYNI